MKRNENPHGRGRGRASRAQATSKANGNQPNTGLQKKYNSHFKPTAEVRFKEASSRHEKEAKEVLQSFEDYFESSSEEEELNDVGILTKLTKSYKGSHTSSGDHAECISQDIALGSTTQYLMECCQSGAITCLVCISSVKRQNAIWSCKKCFAIFHLNCIKQWVLEGVAQATLLSDEHFPNRDQPWFCPKCRNEYSRSECPERYFCFCGKLDEPPLDPWLLPHSCGDKCSKMLQNPACGHQCMLLCHPGPCPPCPQTVSLSCHCGQRPPISRRCGSGKWSCGKVCHKLLACKRHKCQMICHEGECAPCERSSMQPCVCGAQKRIQPCMDPTWSCEKPCNKLLDCGSHRCDKVCHQPGECGKCPRSGVRTCPCGKTKYKNLACTEDVAVCEDTCDKNLGCFGDHRCSRRCHFGDCGSCPLLATKPCRCGRRKKEVLCHKEYICDSKCGKTRSCGKHPCKQKCCVGDCPPCEHVCSRQLQCKKHKCKMLCHQGPCYPCPLTSQVSCNCGGTSITVVCGKEKTTKPPRCRMQCKGKTNCHHPTRIPHNCHFGKCPPCKQICDQVLACGHKCPEKCHDNVVIKNEFKATAPWEKPQQLVEVKKLPCPPCKIPMPVVCRGKHETGEFPCCDVRDYSCGKQCGRQLKCGNHLCTLTCHVVKDSEDDVKAGGSCAQCEEPCAKPRPTGCPHECVSTCHPGDCPPCRKRIKMKCHCGMVALKRLCCEWVGKSQEECARATSCGNHCPKILPACGHMCSLICHPGPCSSAEECEKKVTLKCSCKRKTKNFVCSVVFVQKIRLECDDKCREIKAAKETEKLEAKKRIQEEEERKQREEIERFERKMQKKGRHRKRNSMKEEEQSIGIWGRFADSPIFLYLPYLFMIAGVTMGMVYAVFAAKVGNDDM